jgi:hypothetical protein
MTKAAHKSIAVEGAERRTAVRRDVTIAAKVGFRDLSPIPCTVKNVSPMGALLEFKDDILLPNKFRIIIESMSFWADCEVRHQKGRHAGVMFISNRLEAMAAFG